MYCKRNKRTYEKDDLQRSTAIHRINDHNHPCFCHWCDHVDDRIYGNVTHCVDSFDVKD